MQTITSIEELRNEIQMLEIKQESELVLLKQEFKTTYEGLKPLNFIKNTLKELTTVPDLKGQLLNTTVSLAAGYFSKKAAIGETQNPIKQILGTLLQMGVTSIVSKNADGIKSKIGQVIHAVFNRNIRVKETEDKK